MHSLRGIAVVFIACGLGLLVAAGVAQQRRSDFLDRASVVRGVVVDTERRSANNRRTTYAAVYEYTVDGTERRATGDRYRREEPELGTRDRLFVSPDDPEVLVSDTFQTKWRNALLLGGGGALFTLVGLLNLFLFRSLRRRSTAANTAPNQEQ